MVFLVVLLAAAVLGGLAVWALRRRGSDEMHSVAGYQDRLERLEELRHRQSGSVRVVGSTPPRGETDRPDRQPVIREDGRIEISSSPSRRRVLDDAAQSRTRVDRPAPTRADRPAPPVYRRRRDVSISRMSHRPRRLGAPIAAAAAVIVLVTGLAIAGAHSRGPHSTTSTTSVKKGHGHTTQTTHETTTTVPLSFSPTSTSGTNVTYSLPFQSYTVNFKATNGACYVQVTNSNGTTPYAQVLDQGQTYQIVLSATSKVTLGAPSDIAIEVDRTPVTFPTPLPAPLNITFQGTAPPATTSTT